MAACGAKNAKGKRCGAHALAGTRPPRCFMHAKGKAAAAAKAKARELGGKARMRQVDRGAAAVDPLRIESQADVTAALCRVANEVVQGKLDPRSANALNGSLALLLKPGLLTPTGTYEDFFEQFEDVVVELDRRGDDGEPGNACFGVLPGGGRVRLSGDLERAAYQRLGMPVHDAGIDMEAEGTDEEGHPSIIVTGGAAGGGGPTRIEVRRKRNPTVPPPDEEKH